MPKDTGAVKITEKTKYDTYQICSAYDYDEGRLVELYDEFNDELRKHEATIDRLATLHDELNKEMICPQKSQSSEQKHEKCPRVKSNESFQDILLNNSESLDPLYDDVKKLIDQYNRSLQSRCCFFSSTKNSKLAFLEALKTEYINLEKDHRSLAAALVAIKDNYKAQWSTIIAGGWVSNQTLDLINKIEASQPNIESKRY